MCLKERGGACAGNDTTALPHSSNASASSAVVPVSSGPSQTLTNSVAQLPAQHPAQNALALLNHTVLRQAASLHDHLRGHATKSIDGSSVKKSQTKDGGPVSTATMNMSIGKVQDFHHGLLSSLGTTAWESLAGHCTVRCSLNMATQPGALHWSLIVAGWRSSVTT